MAQELSLCPDLSIADNIWLGSSKVPFLHRAELREKAKAALAMLGVQHLSLDLPVHGSPWASGSWSRSRAC